MAAIASRGRGRRRTINEINMVPFIDVMLVLLIIFMVSAPLITTGVVDLPSVGRSKAQPAHVVHITVGTDEKLKLKVDEGDEAGVTLKVLAERVKAAQAGDDQTPVVISADKAVKYEAVVKVMDVLQTAGIPRVGLAVRNSGAPAEKL
ncbi:ExbD/TolR family protein [Paucibacter sp. R3-3]|uniref:ExbD/TolR family protein n=1 Tax=Roseateles agri TaxID=3098619 RepID=A0ABU5DH12_9BURK|nr:ExbD/TolR family protein [Paucibacter sp. R3-3]MDY0745588.1 ExbD/TolR family protein [Paucibacter sp. R3-3]